jgi:hypothetical protein
MVSLHLDTSFFLRCHLAAPFEPSPRLNAVLRSKKLSADDSIFLLDIAYGSVKKLAAYVASVSCASVHTASMPAAAITSDDALVAAVAAAIPSNARIAVIDHVTSNTGFVLPVKRLVELFHSRGVEVVVDGAHAIGMLDLNLRDLGADYYVRCARVHIVVIIALAVGVSSTAVAFVEAACVTVGSVSTAYHSAAIFTSGSAVPKEPPFCTFGQSCRYDAPFSTDTENISHTQAPSAHVLSHCSPNSDARPILLPQATIVPPIVSHGYGSGFVSSFVWDGCRDYSGVLIVPALLTFWERFGWEAVRTYCRDLCRMACELLVEVCSQLFTVLYLVSPPLGPSQQRCSVVREGHVRE